MRKGWEIKKLDEVCELITCGVAARPDYVDEGIPFLSAKNVKEGQIVWSGYNCISEKTHKELTKNNKPLVGDILYTRVGSYGEAAVVEDSYEFSVFVSLTLIKVDKNVLNNYFLKHYLNSDFVKRLAKKSISGSGVGNLNVGTVREFPIFLPPLSDQQEIVSIINYAFESIERAKSNAEQNLKNTKDLFESYLQNIFEKGNWTKTTLEKLSNKKDSIVSGPFGSNLKVSDYKEKGVPILRLQNIGKGKFINKSIKFITTEKAEELKYHSFKSGDIVLAKLGIPIGKTCIIPDSFDDGIITADIVRIRPDKNIVNYKFLEYFLNTNISVAQLTGNISGATRPRVNLSDVRNIKLALPKLEEQKDIVNELDNLTMKINKLEEILNRKINSLEELKKSLLQKYLNAN